MNCTKPNAIIYTPCYNDVYHNIVTTSIKHSSTRDKCLIPDELITTKIMVVDNNIYPIDLTSGQIRMYKLRRAVAQTGMEVWSTETM